MRYRESLCHEYVVAAQTKQLHPWFCKVLDMCPKQPRSLPHILMYGPQGVGKYSCALQLIAKFSPSALKYEKKLSVPPHRAGAAPIELRMTDVHFEVDLTLLGCNAKSIWSTIYSAILDATAVLNGQHSFILCRNLEAAPPDLLQLMAPLLTYKADREVTFILISEQLTLLPRSLIERCRRITIPRPSRNAYKKIGADLHVKPTEITNIKPLLERNPVADLHKTAAKAICTAIEGRSGLDVYLIRNSIYEALIRNLSPGRLIWSIFKELQQRNEVADFYDYRLIMLTRDFCAHYRYNYRPIYHLEALAISLARLIHELRGSL